MRLRGEISCQLCLFPANVIIYFLDSTRFINLLTGLLLGPLKGTITAAAVAADQASQARSSQSTDTKVAASLASQASQSTDPTVAASQSSQLARNCCRSLGTMLMNPTMLVALFDPCGPVAFGPEATSLQMS